MSKTRRTVKATFDGDIITFIRYNAAPNDRGIEIKPPPAKADFNRLRYVDGNYIDLADLNRIWVDKRGKLHAINIGGICQLVEMQYKDRKNLIKDSGFWRLKTDQERLDTEKKKVYNAVCAKRKQEYPKISDQLDAILKHIEAQGNAIGELQEIINKWRNTKNKFPKG